MRIVSLTSAKNRRAPYRMRWVTGYDKIEYESDIIEYKGKLLRQMEYNGRTCKGCYFDNRGSLCYSFCELLKHDKLVKFEELNEYEILFSELNNGGE